MISVMLFDALRLKRIGQVSLKRYLNTKYFLSANPPLNLLIKKLGDAFFVGDAADGFAQQRSNRQDTEGF